MKNEILFAAKYLHNKLAKKSGKVFMSYVLVILVASPLGKDNSLCESCFTHKYIYNYKIKSLN